MFCCNSARLRKKPRPKIRKNPSQEVYASGISAATFNEPAGRWQKKMQKQILRGEIGFIQYSDKIAFVVAIGPFSILAVTFFMTVLFLKT